MRSCPSYPAQLPNTHLACDRSPPPLSRDATSLQYGCDPSHMLRGAVPKDCSDGEDAVCQDRTIPPSTFSPPTILSEYHQHFLSRLTRTSALAPGFGTYGTRDHALLALYVADNAKYAEATMQPPYARSVPPNQAHTLSQMDPVWNAQSVGLGNPAASYSTHHPVDENEGSLMYTPGTLYVSDDTKYAEATMAPDARPLPHNQAHTLNQMNPVWNVQYAEHGNPVTSYWTPLVDENEGSLMIPPFKPPPHATHSLATADAVQFIGTPRRTAEYGHANSINLGIVGGPHGCWNTRTLFDSSVCPPSNMVPPPSLEPCGHVLSGGIPTSTCPPIASNVADGTMVNAGTIPISLDRPMLRPGGGDNRERMDGIDHNSDNAPYSVAPSWSLSDASRSLPHKLQPTHNIGNLSMPKKSPRTDRSTGPSTSLPTAPKRCGWRDNDGKICDMPVTYNNLVHHFAAVHDIKDMAFDAIIECRWCRPGNRMKRESILRHLREKHLGYPRRKNGVTRLSLQFPSMTSSHSAMNTGTPVESPTFALPYLPYPVSPSSALSPRSCNFSTSASSVAIPPTSPSLWKQNEYSVLDFTSSCDFYRTED